MDGKKVIGGVGGILLLLALGVGVRMYHRAGDSSEIKESMMQAVAAMDGYDKNKVIMDAMAERAHGHAFDRAYTMGGRRRASTFDEEKYVEEFFGSLIRQANDLGRPDIRDAVINLRKIDEQNEGWPEESADPDDQPSDGANPPAAEKADKPPVMGKKSPAQKKPLGKQPPILKNGNALAGTPDEDLENVIYDDLLKRLEGEDKVRRASFRKLSKGERMLYATYVVDYEVNNGGFDQYFANDNGPYARDAVLGFKLVKADRRATLMRRAIAVYVRTNPDQKGVKVDKSVKGYIKKYKDKSFDPLDKLYYELKEDLSRLRIAYIRAHPEEFRPP